MAQCSLRSRWFGVAFVIAFILLSLLTELVIPLGEILDAINAGGGEHVDSSGIRYRADPLEGKTGIASDFGRRLIIQRVHPNDQILYQTERYSHSDFEYKVKIPKDGNYVLVLKFSEVYFNAPNQKVFDIVINDQYIVPNLDIFGRVGRGVAHDEIIPFSISNGNLKLNEEVSPFEGALHIQFKKGNADNPKINAFYIMRGSVEDVPQLMPLDLPQEEEETDDHHKYTEEGQEPGGAADVKSKFASGPKQPNPYALEEQSNILLPIFIALACFLPAVFCLCKL